MNMTNRQNKLPLIFTIGDPSLIGGCFTVMLLILLTVSPVIIAQETSTASSGRGSAQHLADGISLYQNSRFGEALTAFNSAVEMNPHCTLAYYFAARIRIYNKQYPLALTNLTKAIGDSAGFTDAYGLRAYTFDKMGNASDASADWDYFVKSVKSPYANLLIDAGITLPELFHAELSRIEKETREAERMERALIDAESNDQSRYIDAENNEQSRYIGESKAPGLLAAKIAAATSLVAAMIIGMLYLIRRREMEREETNFIEDINAILDGENKDDDSLQDEVERTTREFELKLREVYGDIEDWEESFAEEDDTSLQDYDSRTINPTPSPRDEPPSYSNIKKGIPEEVKVLVTSMYNNGDSFDDICSAADLTKPEVELIIAVRTKVSRNLADDAYIETENTMTQSALYTAINELTAQGQSTVDIAKKLEISTGEVELALEIQSSQP